MKQESLDATMHAVGTKATYAGGATAVSGAFLSSEFVALVGLIIAVAGYLTNVYFKFREDRRNTYYKQRDDKRLQEEHDERMRVLRNE